MHVANVTTKYGNYCSQLTYIIPKFGDYIPLLYTFNHIKYNNAQAQTQTRTDPQRPKQTQAHTAQTNTLSTYDQDRDRSTWRELGDTRHLAGTAPMLGLWKRGEEMPSAAKEVIRRGLRGAAAGGKRN